MHFSAHHSPEWFILANSPCVGCCDAAGSSHVDSMCQRVYRELGDITVPQGLWRGLERMRSCLLDEVG